MAWNDGALILQAIKREHDVFRLMQKGLVLDLKTGEVYEKGRNMKVYRVNAAEWWPGLLVHVALGTERSQKMARKMGYGELPERRLASTSHIDGDDAVLVCIYDGFMDEPKAQRSALIAHEAVHCAQAWCEFIGDDNPGDEEFAYMTQCCVLAIKDGLKAEKKRLKG